MPGVPFSVPGGADLIGAPTVDRLMRALLGVVECGCCSLYDTAHAVLALEDGPEKEALLLRLAAEALFYSNSLREEREADENEATKTVTLTPETHGHDAVRFDDGARSVETTAPSGHVTVTSIDRDVAGRGKP